jgi:hypothetical protein
MLAHASLTAANSTRFQRLREHDRRTNADRYPALDFPHAFVMHGGYAAFFEAHHQLCVPDVYLKMGDPEYSEELSSCLSVLRKRRASPSLDIPARSSRLRRLSNAPLARVLMFPDVLCTSRSKIS